MGLTWCPLCHRALIYTMDREVRKQCSPAGDPDCWRMPTHEDLNGYRPDGGPAAESQQKRMGVE